MSNEELQSLRNSVKGHKGHLTVTIKAAERAISFAGSIPPCDLSVHRLTGYIHALEDRFVKISQGYDELAAIDDDAVTTYAEAAATERDRADETIQRCIESVTHIEAELKAAITSAAPQAAPAAGGGGGGGAAAAQPKPNMALKPGELSKEASPIELRAWMAKFRAYFESSDMGRATPLVQQEYFRACLDASLNNRIRPLIMGNTPVISAAADVQDCFAILDGRVLDQLSPLRQENGLLQVHPGQRPALLGLAL